MDSIVNPSIEGDPLPPAGARFGPYLLKERIGRGGMAVVYKAKIEGPNGFEKTVVVKALLPALISKPEFLEMFTSEAKTTAQMSHPGIVHVYDFGLIDTTPYLVMEYLDGIDLSRLLAILKARSERMPIDIAVVIATQVCNALGYAHQFRDATGKRLQIIHGDVSPSNVLACRDGTVKLLDFGVSRVLGEFDFDLSHQLKGKFAYMAPEQVRRQPFDRRVDVFAAGITLYEMLTGQRLFFGSSDKETLKRVHAAQVQPPSTFNPEVSAELDAIVLKALKRDPGDRWESGDEMAIALMSVSRVGRGRQRVAAYLAQVAENSTPTDSAIEPSATETIKADPGLMLFGDVAMPTPLKAPPPVTAFVPPPPIVATGATTPEKKRRPPTITMLVRPLVALEQMPKKQPMLLIAILVMLGGLTVGSVAGLVHRLWSQHARAAKLAVEPTAVPMQEVKAPEPVQAEPQPAAGDKPPPDKVKAEPVAEAAPAQPEAQPVVTPIDEPAAPLPAMPKKKRNRHKAHKAAIAHPPHAAPAPVAAPPHKAAPPAHKPSRPEPRGPSVKDGDLVDPYGIEGDGE